MDVALGMSMTSPTISMVLTEGESADGVTVDQDVLDVPAGEAVSERVVAAITEARSGTAEAGNRLTSIGVAFRDPVEADLLRDALVRHRVDDVMVVSAFLAAVALTQAVGCSVGHANTTLIFVEPGTVTLATVNADDGAIADVHRHRLGDADLADELAQLVSGLADVPDPPDGVFVVGSGVEIALVKSRLEAATRLSVSVPGEPALALARGAALASAHAPLFASSTRAMAWAQDFGTGSVDPAALGGYSGVLASLLVPAGIDYNATSDNAALAYSALADSGVVDGLDADYRDTRPAEGLTERVDSALLDFRVNENDPRGRLLVLVGSAAAVVVTAISALVVSLVVGTGAHQNPQPRPGAHVVPSQQATPPKPAAPAPPPAAPAPAPEAPAPAPEAPVPAAPAPVVRAPAPPPAAPAPPPAPVIIPLPIPGLPDIGGRPRNDRGDDRWGPQRGGDHDDDDGGGWAPKLPFLPGGNDHGRGKLKIPGIPGL